MSPADRISDHGSRHGNRRSRAAFTLKLLILLIVTGALPACGKVDVKWREEVRLASGETIIVARTAQGKRLGEIGGSGGWEATRMTVEIDDPKRPANPPAWSDRWVPMLFDFDPDTKEWFLVATFYTCTDWYDLGRPKLPYVQYRTRDGRWEQVPLDTKLFGRPANLLTGVNAGGEPKLVSIEAKERRSRGAGKKFRHIVDVWPTSC
jgi:hypothetical protein